MTNGRGSRASRWATGLLLCIALGGSVLGAVWASRRGSESAGVLPLDDEHMPLEISGPGDFEHFLLGLRSYQYRARRRAGTSIREYYYDTADWTLARRSHAYVLARRTGDDGVASYSVRLSGVEEEGAFEISSEVPGPLGEAITEGEWQRGLPGRLELASAPRLGEVLAGLDVSEEALDVRGVGDAAIEHYDVRDKGRTWFELDYEEWLFSAFGADADEEAGRFRWYGIELRPGDEPLDQEFRERVHQMERVLPTFYRFRPGGSRLTRAVAALQRPG